MPTTIDINFLNKNTDWRCRSDGRVQVLAEGKRKADAVSVGGMRVVSGAEIEAGESVTIVVDHLH